MTGTGNNVWWWVFASTANALTAAAAWALAYTGIPGEPLGVLVALMTLDFFAGVVAARTVLEPVTSYRMRRGAASKVGLLSIPLVLALAAKGLGADFTWLVGWVVSIFILSEAYSIVGHVYTIRTGESVPEWDAVAIVLRKMRELMDQLDKRN